MGIVERGGVRVRYSKQPRGDAHAEDVRRRPPFHDGTISGL
jgi:hypothetical protein